MNQHSSDQRQERVIAASIRAAYAWTVREQFAQYAMKEICRMTGVVVEAHGPGRAPTGPMALVEALRRPLSELSLPGYETDFTAIKVLDAKDRLTDDAYNLAAEFACSLSRDSERTEAWLPRWTRMRADRVSREVFRKLVESGDQEVYVNSRRFIVENPCAREDTLLDARVKAGARPAGSYNLLAAHQKYVADDGVEYWWPCPVCKYPMTVETEHVRCGYRWHEARFQLDATATRPKLLKIDSHGGPQASAAQRAEGVVCVEPAVWRSVVVPGVTELRIANRLSKYSEVRLWPCLDSYDLHVVIGDFQYDVKEYASVDRLIADLRERRADAVILIPKTHAEQVEILRTERFAVVSERDAVRLARRAAKEAS